MFDNPFYIIGLFALAIIIFVMVYLVDKATNSKMLKRVPFTLKREVYGYLDKHNHVISFTPSFFDKLNIYKKKQAKWYKEVTSININGKNIEAKDLISYLYTNTEKDLNMVFDIDSKHITISAQVLPVEDDDLLGYIIVAPQSQSEGKELGFLEIMDDLYNPCAFYSGDIQNINLTINESFQSKIEKKAEKITLNELRKYVFEDDLEIFDKQLNDMTNNGIVRYHLKTNVGLELFEETKRCKNNQVVIVISLLELDDKKEYLSVKDLSKAMNSLFESQTEFGGVIVSLKSLMEESENYSSNVSKEIAWKYIDVVKNDLLRGNDLICKINDFEYIFIIKNMEDFNLLIDNIKKEISMLLKYEIDFGNKEIKMNNKLGLVYPGAKNTTDFLNNLDSALAFANNEGYDKCYSIYSPKQETEETKEEYSFEKLKVDLDNSFLKDGE